MRLKNKVAVVTGGASGIGKGAALRFAEEGAKIVLGDVSEEALEKAVNEIKEKGAEAMGVMCNVGDSMDVSNIMNRAKETFGSLDILVNNVGVGTQATLLDTQDEDLDRAVDTNFKGQVKCAREAAKIMVEQKNGVIISTSSGAGIHGMAGNAVYAGNKSAILRMSRDWAKELGPMGVRVNCIVPGPTRTPSLMSIPQEQQDYLATTIPLQRLGEPKDLGDAFVFLASDEASFVTGATLEVTGGSTG